MEPIWMVQLWFMAYYPDLFNWKSLVSNDPVACYYKYVIIAIWNKSSFGEFFNYFFSLLSKKEKELLLLYPLLTDPN